MVIYLLTHACYIHKPESDIAGTRKERVIVVKIASRKMCLRKWNFTQENESELTKYSSGVVCD